MEVNFSHYEFMTQHTGQWSKILALVSSQDDIGVMLRAHLLLEQALESWCICATGNNGFFNGFGNGAYMDFAAKAQLAHNFGLSGPVFKFVKKLNRFRNERAHRIESMDITTSEIDSLSALMSIEYPQELKSMGEFCLEVLGDRKVSFGDPTTNLRDKFIMLFSMLTMRMSSEAKILATSNGFTFNYYGHERK